MSSLIASVVLALVVASQAVAPQQFTRDEVKEISGRWIGTVTTNIGSMPIALDVREDKDAGLTGTLETGHGNWAIAGVTRKGDTWRFAIKAPDGLEGTMSGRVKEGRLAGDWNFAPRAVGTFDLARPAAKR